ncbi:MAG: aminoacyl-tRNA hydrolase [Candidatus Nanopelagicales bacterium]
MTHKPWLIVGLGNPGDKYANTRHNIGYLVVETLAARMGTKLSRHRRANADAAEGQLSGHRVVLLRSRGYMNESGGPVKAAADYSRIPPDRIVVVQDEIDIPFGVLRIKLGGGDGGHNGLKSIRSSLGTGDFYRVRVGVDRPPGRQDAADYVLRAFKGSERKELPEVIDRAADAVESLIVDGLSVAQNNHNSQ